MPRVPLGEGEPGDAAMQQSPWRNRAHLSSIPDAAERFLDAAGFDRGPWIAVAFAAGIAAWFVLPTPAAWTAGIAGALLLATGALAAWRGRPDRVHLLAACTALGLLLASGIAVAWARSATVGTPALDRPVFAELTGRVLERIEQPAQQRTRLVLATREPGGTRAIRIRVNVPVEADDPAFSEGAVVRLRARLMPPAAPMLPGAYNFARSAWFEGFAATGSALGEVQLLEPGEGAAPVARLQRRLSEHVRGKLAGSPGAIAAAFASGDRGAIGASEEEAMRDSGLTHLLSISGLHVSAVIAGAYFLALRLFAFWPWLALRVRLPLLAAMVGAGAGIGYTLLTGAEVPTVRSCVAAVLVLGALALGREPLSLRMVAVAAIFVLLLWPESLAGPSFQMSFAAVIAIVALHGSAPVRGFLAPREEGWATRIGRRIVMLLVTGLAIEIVLMPIVMFHFHRAGFYGALANMVAIPLVTFVSMPAIAFALALDLFGLGAPAWWVVGKSLDVLLWIADFTASRPGAVKLMAQMSMGAFALFVIGGLWLALWQGRSRLLGLIPIGFALISTAATSPPDLLISGDGRHVGATSGDGRLLMLRDTNSDYVRDNLTELAAVDGDVGLMAAAPTGDCSADFCVLTLDRAGRPWRILMSRSREIVPERALAAACERADIVVSDRWLPATCRPRWLKADGRMLGHTGGLAVSLEDREFDTVAAWQGEHGWWRGRDE